MAWCVCVGGVFGACCVMLLRIHLTHWLVGWEVLASSSLVVASREAVVLRIWLGIVWRQRRRRSLVGVFFVASFVCVRLLRVFVYVSFFVDVVSCLG